MSERPAAPGFGPYAFELTEDEARVAAARAGLRGALAGRLTSAHFAPLAAFVLAISFTAILALTGLVSRRFGEVALLLAIAAFMAQRLTTLRRFAAARRASVSEFEAMRDAGPLVVSVDETGLGLGGAAPARWNFVDCLEAEDAGGLIYLWPRSGLPAIVPTRVFEGAEAAAEFVEFLRGRLPRRLALPPPGR
ncbi:MAG: hypothetical protein ABSC22_09445 [Roseiarcus sp.]|jgi:hypothetical protein